MIVVFGDAMDARRGWPLSINPEKNFSSPQEREPVPPGGGCAQIAALAFEVRSALEDDVFSPSGALSRRESINALA